MSQTICFFGATGGVANACLSHILRSGDYNVIAMVRTPEKLRKQLINKQEIDAKTIDRHLTVVPGNATQLKDVKAAILARVTGGKDATLPSMIISGLGGAPSLTFNIGRPLQFLVNDQPTLCEDAAHILIAALKEIYADRPALTASKPAAIFVSTTGVSRGPDDVPFMLRFLYHQMLHSAHQDKKKMENLFRNNLQESYPVFSGVTGIRPTLLIGEGVPKEGKGLEHVRAGVESKPETGYIIQRADVGHFMFEKVVKAADGGKWRGEMISLA